MNIAFRSQKALALLAVGGGLLVVAGAWFLLVSPKKSRAGELEQQVAALETQLAQRGAKPRTKITVRASDFYRLSKAMPDKTDMPGIMLELNRLASGSGVRFTSITPSAQLPGSTGFTIQPFDVLVEGRYTDVSRFLERMRSLVTVHGSRLDASGRLFAVDRVGFAQGGKGFPDVEASLKVNAFVFTGVRVGGTGAAPGTTPQAANEIPATPAAAETS